MKRKMIGAASAYIAGLFFAFFFINVYAPVILTAAVIFTAAFGKRQGFSRLDFAALALFFTAAVCVGALSVRNEKVLCEQYEGRTLPFTGKVTEVRSYPGDKCSYTLKGRSGENRSIKAVFYADDVGAAPGDVMTIGECTFEAPGGDYLFDEAAYYRSSGISCSISGAKDVSFDREGPGLKRRLMEYRSRMIWEIRSKTGSEEGGFIVGMVFGTRQYLEDDTSTSLYRLGIGHILAVSGLHVSVIAIFIMKLCRLCRLRRPIALLITDAVIILFVIMADSPVSAVRAAVMLNFLYAAGLFRRQNDTLNSLGGAMLIIAVCDPYCIFSSGFIMSVAGTFGIGVFGPYMTAGLPSRTIPQRMLKKFLILLCTSVFIMPFSMKYFGETSLIAPLTNMVLIFPCTAAMVTGAIYVLTGGKVDMLETAAYLLKAVLWVSEKASSFRGTFLSCGSERLTALAFVLTGIAGLAAAIVRSRKAAALAVTAVCCIFFTASAVHDSQERKRFKVAVLGRGSNAAAVVAYEGHADVIDLSGHYKSPAYVSKYLRANGLSRADSIMLTTSINSQYTAYISGLNGVDTGHWTAVGSEILMPDEEVVPIGEGTYDSQWNERRISYANGVVTIEYGGSRAVIAPASADPELLPEWDILVLWGRAPKDIRSRELSDVIILDGGENDDINNFEITFSAEGGMEIRRL